MKRTAVLLLALAALPAVAQYKYATPDGKTVYSDQPPPAGARNVQQRDFAGEGATIDSSRMPYELRRAAENFPVTLYTIPNCPGCDAGRALLVKRGIPFNEKTVTTPDDANFMKAQNFGNSYPILVVGSTRAINFNDASWQSVLDVAGYSKTPAPPGSFRNPAPSAAAPAQPSAPAASNARTTPPAAAKPATPAQPANNPNNPAGIRF